MKPNTIYRTLDSHKTYIIRGFFGFVFFRSLIEVSCFASSSKNRGIPHGQK